MDLASLEYMFLSVMGVWLALELYCVSMLPGAIWLRVHCRGRWLNHWRMFADSSGKPPQTYRLYYRERSGSWREAWLLAHQPGPFALIHCPQLALMTWLFKKTQSATRQPTQWSKDFGYVQDYVVSLAKARQHEPEAIRVVTDGGPYGGAEKIVIELSIRGDDS